MAIVVTPPLTRWIVLDDTDPRIEYAGSWSEVDTRLFDNVGNFGATFGGTQHLTATQGNGFNFKFNGTSVLVQGTMPSVSLGVATGVMWNCIIDGEVTTQPRSNVAMTSLNNFVLCRYDGLTPGEHTFGVEVMNNGANFYVDRLAYGALNSVPTPLNKVVQVGYDDRGIVYSGGDTEWTTYTAYARSLNSDDPGATVSFNFTGTSVAWYTASPNGIVNASRASYQIDDEAPVTFDIPGGFDAPRLNQKYFHTPSRASGDHRLTVKYLGQRGQMPLSLAYMEVTNIPTVSPGVSSTAANEGQNGLPLAPIVGGLAGALVLLAMMGLFVWYRLRSRARAAAKAAPIVAYAAPMRSQAPPISISGSEKKMGSV
ncbi:hypothetical protein NLJ89_g1899 [Agrocybe chaxingu]|uniref:Uncharacterized protein n=1 Tax=Agrocybe chaxingu TaxID=84603 RepID=A0A9W8MZ60_9AGAR|nr:hypothetical protein NLJ89_g1899 [Agrocybe chaxingu]